jgi:hypothetical protein
MEPSAMRYLHSYQYVFISPKWLHNLGFGTLCVLVRIVGDIVLMGYQFEMIEAMLRDGEENYPDFDANRIVAYFLRGAWPFIIEIVIAIPLIVMLILCIVSFVGVMIGTQGDPGIAFFLLFGGLFLLVIFFAGVVLPLLVMPLEIRAGLSKSLRAAFSRAFYVDFVKRCWKELIFAQLFVFFSGFVLFLVGMLLCGLGTVPAQALTMFARSHLMYQIYSLYLERGGIPPAVKDETVQL